MKRVADHFSMSWSFVLMCGVATVFAVAAFPSTAAAQFQSVTQQADIRFSPTTLRPESEVTASLNVYSIDISGSSIRWFINGTERTDAQNTREVTFTTGSLGEEIVVRAVITPRNGAPVTVTRSGVVSDIDIIIEADTYVPAFYEGRPLPNAGATLRAIAIPHTPNTSGLTYTWRLDNTVLFGGGVRGKNVAEFEYPRFGDPILSVTVTDARGAQIAHKATQLRARDPETHLYTVNPLRGISPWSVGETFALREDEVTLAAIPYFVQPQDANTREYVSWELDGSPVESAENNRRYITLRRTGGSGTADLSFSFRSGTRSSQSTTGNVEVLFTE